MMNNKKKMATIIVGKLKPESETADFVQKIGEKSEGPKWMKPKEEVSDASMAQESAAEDMIEAFEKKDAKMLLVSIKNLIELLQEIEASEDEE